MQFCLFFYFLLLKLAISRVKSIFPQGAVKKLFQPEYFDVYLFLELFFNNFNFCCVHYGGYSERYVKVIYLQSDRYRVWQDYGTLKESTFLFVDVCFLEVSFNDTYIMQRKKKRRCEKFNKISRAREIFLQCLVELVHVMFQCGYSTHTVEVMRRHVLTHVKDKPYKCNLCKHSYIQRSQLLRHIDTHTGFVCFHCELRFPNKAR